MSDKLFSVNDPVHGLMQFREDEAKLIKAIIKIPEFQRLRYIKQLGMAFFVYPGANHNRFSHSLGAAYLAKRLIEKLAADFLDSEEKRKIKSATQLSIVAGLLHDIGHGPYSHVFERVTYGEVDLKFDHEKMTDLIVKKLSRSRSLEAYHDVLKSFIKIKDKGKDKKSLTMKKILSAPSFLLKWMSIEWIIYYVTAIFVVLIMGITIKNG